MNAWDIRRAAQIPMWRERIQKCRSSGLTVRRWCEENQVHIKTYYRWEKRCLEKATETICTEQQTGTLTKITPELLPSNREETESSSSNASAELVIRCGCVSMDISPQMPVAKIAELVSALNSHV